MICNGCGAHLLDGTKKCPYCQELISGGNTSASDVTYKIDSPKQFELIKNSTRIGQKLKNGAKIKRKKRNRKIKGYCILLGMLIVLISIIVGIISLFISIFSDDTQYPTAFYDNNTLKLCYEGEVVTLTDEAIDLKTLDENENLIDNIPNVKLITSSKDGMTTCFVDKFNMEKNYGTLKVIVEGEKDEIVTISDKVNGSVLISDDGEHILFIKNANPKGNKGELWYSNQGDRPIKIADGVDVSRFVFSYDYEKVIYIKNYNYTAHCGGLYVADLDDFTEVKIDKDVYAVYGSSEDEDGIIYSKGFNETEETFDIYIKNGSKLNRLVIECKNSPIKTADGEYIFACGNESNGRFSLYRIDTNEAYVEKIISNMSEVIRVSDDGEQVLYSKQFDNNVSDYYIWTEGEAELKVADGVNYTKANQIAVSEDFEKIAFISNYDENKKGGTLYFCDYYEDSVSEAVEISKDVFNCYVLENKNIVYNKNYSSKGKTAELYVYNGIENEINSEINPRFVNVKNDDIICLYDYSENSGGNLYVVNEDFETIKLTTDVYKLYVKKNGVISILKNKNSGKFDLYETDEDKEFVVLIQKDIDGILKY